MGVKGLFQFLRRFEQHSSIQEAVSGQSVGIDIFWFIHQSKGDMFALQGYLLPIIRYAHAVHCVFDGVPSPERLQYLKEQARKRHELITSIAHIEAFLKYPFHHLTHADRQCIYEYLYQLKQQAWQPSPDFVFSVKSWLETKGCHIHQAPNEADYLLIQLETDGVINAIITNDSDMLLLGSNRVIRLYGSRRAAIFDKQHICSVLNYTDAMWHDFMYICKYMKSPDILLAHSLISVYKDLEYVLQKYDTLIDEQHYPQLICV